MIKSLSIVFPFYNEELRLKASFNHILNFIKKKTAFKIEIIFVDDGSDDNSYELINRFIKNSRKNNKIKFKIIKSKNNLGKGSALKLGIKKLNMIGSSQPILICLFLFFKLTIG